MDCFRALTLTSFLVLFFTLCSSGRETSAADRGEALFRQKCASCHTVQGGSARGVGPDLKGVTARRDRKWLLDFIVYTDRMLASDPLAQRLLKEYGNIPMPTMGLTRADGAAVVDYLARLDAGQEKKEAPPPRSSQKEASPEGADDAARGRALFVGALPFQRGGPPCFACHAAAGDAPLGGGTLGPGLTDVFTRYGEEGLSAMLSSLATPTMQPLYGERPLAPGEHAALKAFFQKTALRKPARPFIRIVAPAIGLFAAMLLLMQGVWRKRLRAVRKPLVESTGVENIPGGVRR